MLCGNKLLDGEESSLYHDLGDLNLEAVVLVGLSADNGSFADCFSQLFGDFLALEQFLGLESAIRNGSNGIKAYARLVAAW